MPNDQCHWSRHTTNAKASFVTRLVPDKDRIESLLPVRHQTKRMQRFFLPCVLAVPVAAVKIDCQGNHCP
jgi:hypothetical protein